MKGSAASRYPRAPTASFLPGAPRPLRIAHRGASARAPENTFPAFEEARRLGADAIEIDVHLTADGVPVVIHDETVDRTTNGHGSVAALPLSALRRLDAGSWFERRFRGALVPTLDETLEWARGRIGLNVEIKADRPVRAARPSSAGHSLPGVSPHTGIEALVRAVARAISRADLRDSVIVSSFDREALERARGVMPWVPLGLLASRSSRRLLPLHRRVTLHAFHPHHRLASRRRILSAHRHGLAVLVWPVNSPALMRRIVERGADGLMTDDPALFERL